MNDIFEELIQTIERNAVDNVTTISDVKLFAKSWREEFKLHENIYSQSRADICKETEEWRTCKSWTINKRCLKDCKFHKNGR